MATIDLNKLTGRQIRTNGVVDALGATANVTVDRVDTTNGLISGHFGSARLILPVAGQSYIRGVGATGELPLDP